jgi:hypothetical protein
MTNNNPELLVVQVQVVQLLQVVERQINLVQVVRLMAPRVVMQLVREPQPAEVAQDRQEVIQLVLSEEPAAAAHLYLVLGALLQVRE